MQAGRLLDIADSFAATVTQASYGFELRGDLAQHRDLRTMSRCTLT